MNAREVVDTTGSPAFAVDRHGTFLAWNAAARESLGWDSKEVLGRKCFEVLQGEDCFGNRYCGANCPLRERALLGGPINPTQISFCTPCGDRQMVRLSVLVVPEGGPVGKAIVHLMQCLAPGEGVLTGGAAVRRGEGHNGNSHLTLREIEVLAHLGDGKGTVEIAEMLCLSPSTVRHHLQNLFTKLKVHGRLQAVALGRKLGLI
jgi:DNA-binding CsgD family transcriptional regulator